MTDKQEKILESALELFANEGYNATSTNKIARKAGVSEGLIFRHFENKKGLLEAIMRTAEAKIASLIAKIIREDQPKMVIRKTIGLPYSIDKSEYDFWKLQFKLKWETSYNNPAKMQPLLDKLSWAFSELNYSSPDQEAQLLIQILDATSTDILQGNMINENEFEKFLIDKYEL